MNHLNDLRSSQRRELMKCTHTVFGMPGLVLCHTVFLAVFVTGAMWLGNPTVVAQDRSGNEFFETKIRPILVKHCYECHSRESGKSRGGLRVDFRDALLRGGDNGGAIIAGDSQRSLLYQSIAYHGDYPMPPTGKLPDGVIADFERWIEMGAPDPRRMAETVEVASEIDVNAGRQFWAYQRPNVSEPPTVRDSSWATTEIDRFVLARLEAEGLKPSKAAPPSVLVRRLFFVLTGLPPPTPAVQRWQAEIDAGDGRLDPSAVARLVDGLLGTRFYGERWGRHWLDVARFAESTGGDSNNIHQHAWRYRDYVIDSFHSDKPFDQFIKEQIAGDLLPIGSDAEWAENIIATGFLAVGLKLVGEEDSQQFFADLVDEQIDATTRAFLGTSVACARCHDHKSDPIPQADYYALAGIFRATETHYGLLRAQARQATTLIDITGLGPKPGAPKLTADEYAAVIQARDHAKKAVDDAMKKIRGGENVFRGTLRRIRSVRDETEAALQAYDERGNPKVFAMGTQDRDFPLPTRLLLRGEIDKPAQTVPRGFVQVLSRPGRHSLSSRVRGSGRLELAEWIASEQNPLVARVIVNRVWHWMFGRGIVRTVDDFGASGEEASHPELLDHLAARFVANGWSIKKLVREIALTKTWQQASHHDESNFRVDPDNRLLWRMNKRRLEAEAIRDAMLFASGGLNAQRPLGTLLREVGEGNVGQNVFEPAIRAIESNHRSVYLPRVRNVLPECLELYDAPDAGAVAGMRATTASPLQSLYMMNNHFVDRQAEGLAKLALRSPSDERVDFLYLRLLGRRANPTERELADQFLKRSSSRQRINDPQRLVAYAQVLMCTSEFCQID